MMIILFQSEQMGRIPIANHVQSTNGSILARQNFQRKIVRPHQASTRKLPKSWNGFPKVKWLTVEASAFGEVLIKIRRH